MCGLCNILEPGPHFSTSTLTPRPARAMHLERVRLADAVARGLGMRVRDFSGSAMLVTSASGASRVVGNLSQLWHAMEALGAPALDPLNEGFPTPPGPAPGR